MHVLAGRLSGLDLAVSDVRADAAPRRAVPLRIDVGVLRQHQCRVGLQLSVQSFVFHFATFVGVALFLWGGLSEILRECVQITTELVPQ